MDPGSLICMRVVLAICLLSLVSGCSAALKESNNELEAQIEELEAQVHIQQDELLLLQAELDTCEEAVDRKALVEVLQGANIDPALPLHADVETSMGSFRIELWPTRAPRTVANFVGLAEGSVEWTDPATGDLQVDVPLYRELLFHRVIPGFMIQTGDPSGKGTGGPGFTFADEFSDEALHDQPGVVSMANAGPDTNGSQFFVTLAERRHLDRKHSAFGRVVEGMDVVQAIAQVPAGSQRRYRPDQDIYLRRVTIIRGP